MAIVVALFSLLGGICAAVQRAKFAVEYLPKASHRTKSAVKYLSSCAQKDDAAEAHHNSADTSRSAALGDPSSVDVSSSRDKAVIQMDHGRPGSPYVMFFRDDSSHRQTMSARPDSPASDFSGQGTLGVNFGTPPRGSPRRLPPPSAHAGGLWQGVAAVE